MRKDNLSQNNVSDLPVNDLDIITMKMFQQSKYSMWTQRWNFLSFLLGKTWLAEGEY